MRFRSNLAFVVSLAACGWKPWPPPASPWMRGGVTVTQPKCVAARSCVVGQVMAAESAAPLAGAAVFLQRESDAPARANRILTLTDDQGVFSVVNAPRGRYRLAIYKDARKVEVRGLQLGAPGTMMIPVRLPPG